MTSTTSKRAVIEIINKLLFNIKTECAVNIRLHVERNKELFYSKLAEAVWCEVYGLRCEAYELRCEVYGVRFVV